MDCGSAGHAQVVNSAVKQLLVQGKEQKRILTIPEPPEISSPSPFINVRRPLVTEELNCTQTGRWGSNCRTPPPQFYFSLVEPSAISRRLQLELSYWQPYTSGSLSSRLQRLYLHLLLSLPASFLQLRLPSVVQSLPLPSVYSASNFLVSHWLLTSSITFMFLPLFVTVDNSTQFNFSSLELVAHL